MSLAFEVKYPNRVKGLILIDPHDDGIVLKDDPYSEAISSSIAELEKVKTALGRRHWNEKLTHIKKHLSLKNTAKFDLSVLIENLNVLVNSLDPKKYLRAMFSEWRALHSSSARVKNNLSTSLTSKPLMVLSSDPTNKRSEGRLYLHRKIAKLSNRGKILIASGAGHDIAKDRPDLIVKSVEEFLGITSGRSFKKIDETYSLKKKGPVRFFVDGTLADTIRLYPHHKKTRQDLQSFCRQLELGFDHSITSGYRDHRGDGLGGYFVICE